MNRAIGQRSIDNENGGRLTSTNSSYELRGRSVKIKFAEIADYFGRLAGPALNGAINGKGIVGFPESHFDDGKSLTQSEIENQLGDVFGRRVHVHQEDRFVLCFEMRQDGVVLVQDHAMIEVGVDPGADDALDGGEVDDHAERIEPIRLQGDDGAAVVPVQMPALAVVLQQAMAVAEADLARDLEHVWPPERFTACGVARLLRRQRLGIEFIE